MYQISKGSITNHGLLICVKEVINKLNPLLLSKNTAFYFNACSQLAQLLSTKSGQETKLSSTSWWIQKYIDNMKISLTSFCIESPADGLLQKQFESKGQPEVNRPADYTKLFVVRGSTCAL